MKTIIVIILSVLFLDGAAQEDSILAKNYRLDFAVPDHPAFNIIDNNDDKILRPANSREAFSLIYSNFFTGNAAFIPKNFSMEFSPAQLIGINKITLGAYVKDNWKRIIYDTKFSIGSKVNSKDSLHDLAIGLRFTWVDKTLLSQNEKIIEDFVGVLGQKEDIRGKFIDSLCTKNEMHNNLKICRENLAPNEDLKNYVDSIFAVYYTKLTADYSRKSSPATVLSIPQFRSKYKNATWNKTKFETAIAIKYSSPDSLFQDTHYSKFNLWNTFAFPIKTWGQGLLGLNLSNENIDSVKTTIIDSSHKLFDTTKHSNTAFTVASRIYAGENNFKAFLEGSVKYGSNHILQPALNCGAEINILDGLWGVINFGNIWSKNTTGNNNKWQSNFYWKLDLRFHLPEKKKA